MAAADKKAATASAVVAKGRSIVGDDKKTYLAGESISLPDDEVERLSALGFLASAGESQVAAGPSLTSSDGPSIRVA